MPIYEYKCGSCGNDFEKIVRAGMQDSEISCPKCNKNESKRKLSRFSFGTRSASGDFKSSSSCSCGGNCGSCSGSCGHHH